MQIYLTRRVRKGDWNCRHKDPVKNLVLNQRHRLFSFVYFIHSMKYMHYKYNWPNHCSCTVCAKLVMQIWPKPDFSFVMLDRTQSYTLGSKCLILCFYFTSFRNSLENVYIMVAGSRLPHNPSAPAHYISLSQVSLRTLSPSLVMPCLAPCLNPVIYIVSWSNLCCVSPILLFPLYSLGSWLQYFHVFGYLFMFYSLLNNSLHWHPPFSLINDRKLSDTRMQSFSTSKKLLWCR